MIVLVTFITIFNIVPVSSNELMVDFLLKDVPTTAQFKCLKQSFNEIVLWISANEQGISEQSMQAYINAKNAGFKVHIVMAPCRSVAVGYFVEDLQKKLG